MRYAVSIIVGVAVALGLFMLMHELISGPRGPSALTHEGQPVDFIRVVPDEVTRPRERHKPVTPPPPRKPPPTRMTVTAPDEPAMPPMHIPAPQIPVSPSTAGGPYLGAYDPADPGAEGDIIPIIRIQPQYPRAALVDGIEGWVEVEFTINEDGSVSDAAVLRAEPPRLFNRAAQRAVMRWKFKPRVVQGVAVKRRAAQVIEFRLDPG